jgi:hypothetical protein
MPPRSRSYRLGGARHGAVIASYGTDPIAFPWPGAAADLDFIRRQYRWNNASRTEADFTTLVLNGATWGPQGLDFSTATSNPSITITLAALGMTMPPCCYAVGGYFLSTPAATKVLLQFDDTTNAERFVVHMNTVPVVNLQTFDNSVAQSNQSPGSIAPGASRFGLAVSAQLNEVLGSGNGTDATADSVATMPTVTQLRLGCNATAATFPPGILSRLVIFTAVKAQAEINLLSRQMRDVA